MNLFLILGLFAGILLTFFLSYYLTIEFNQKQSDIAFEELENKVKQFNEESNFLREQMAFQARDCAQNNSSINCLDSVKITYRNLLYSIIERFGISDIKEEIYDEGELYLENEYYNSKQNFTNP